MATPEAYAAALLDFAGLEISQYLRERLNDNDRILDVGAGWGKYRFLLPEYEMDAVEVFEPYVKKHKLNAYYRKVYVNDMVGFTIPQRYAACTMGDVLEHIPAKEAYGVVEELCRACDFVCIAVPFEMHQEEVEGNHHEAHQQEDLTAKVMAERFPQLQLYKQFGRPGEHVKAIYIKKDTK